MPVSERFDLGDGFIVLPVSVMGRYRLTIHLALDTGSRLSMLNRTILHEIGCNPMTSDKPVRLMGSTGIGYTTTVRVPKVEALGVVREDVRVMCQDLSHIPGIDGVLGLDFFRDRKLTPDFRQSTVTVE